MSVNLSKSQIFQLFPMLNEIKSKELQSGVTEIAIEIANEMA